MSVMLFGIAAIPPELVGYRFGGMLARRRRWIAIAGLVPLAVLVEWMLIVSVGSH
jgi:hypothetical protein